MSGRQAPLLVPSFLCPQLRVSGHVQSVRTSIREMLTTCPAACLVDGPAPGLAKLTIRRPSLCILSLPVTARFRVFFLYVYPRSLPLIVWCGRVCLHWNLSLTLGSFWVSSSWACSAWTVLSAHRPSSLDTQWAKDPRFTWSPGIGKVTWRHQQGLSLRAWAGACWFLAPLATQLFLGIHLQLCSRVGLRSWTFVCLSQSILIKCPGYE